MSLEVKYLPQDYRTVYNPVEIVMFETSGTTRGYTGFAYLIDVKIGLTTIGRLRVPPTTTGFGRFDLSGIMKSYISSDKGLLNGTNIDSVYDNTNSYTNFTLQFGWVHYNTGSATTSIPQTVTLPDTSTTSSQNLIVFNGALPNYRRDVVNFYDWQSTDYYLKYIPNIYSNKFLTNQPRGSAGSSNNLEVQYTDEGYIYLLMDNITNFDIINLKTYRSNGNLIDDIDITVPTLTNAKHVRIPYAPNSLNSINTTYLTGSQPIVSTSASYYSIQLEKSSIFKTEPMFYNIATECRYETRRLEFLNSLGGFDYYNFTKVSKHSEEIERKFFKTNPSDLDTDTGVINYSISNRQKVQYYTSSKNKMKLNSDYMTVETYNWLLELIESPEIYLLDNYTTPSGTTEIRRIPVQNIEGNWEEKTINSDMVCSLSLDIEFGIDNYRQTF